MAQVKVPLVAHWNSSGNCCVTTPDGGLLYVGFRTINFIGDINAPDEAPFMKVFHTRQSVLDVDVDPNWNINRSDEIEADVDYHSNYFAIVSKDNSVQIWDFDKGCAVRGHKVHCTLYSMEGNGPPLQYTGYAMISYMRNRNVLSVDNRCIVIYCVASNSYYRHSMFSAYRNHQLTALKCCPYSENYFALGTNTGLILLCDLQRMCIVHTLCGHNAAVVSLAWNIMNFDTNGDTDTITKAPDSNAEAVKMNSIVLNESDCGAAFNIYEYNYLENEFGAPSQSATNISDNWDSCHELNNIKQSTTNTEFNFAEACQNLKYDIMSMKKEETNICLEHVVTLEDCKSSNAYYDDSYSNYDSQSLNGNLDTSHDKNNVLESNFELINHSYSDESMHVDGIDKFSTNTSPHQGGIAETQLMEANMNATPSKPNRMISDRQNQENSLVVITPPDLAENRKFTVDLKGNDLKSDIILASAGIDGSMWIWNAALGSSYDCHRIRDCKRKSVFPIYIQWLNSTTLIINSKAGNLYFWTKDSHSLKPSRTYKFKEVQRKSLHKGVVAFSVNQGKQLMWCISSYRQISLEDLAKHELKIGLACASSNISALAECPDDMNKIAIGFCDKRIGIIDISNISPAFIHIDNYIQHVESFVLSLAWNPDNTKIAYGTYEGRIGVINVDCSSSNAHLSFKPTYGKPVYSLIWMDNYIFAVCNDRIAVYDTDNVNEKDANIISNINGVSTITNYNTCLIVGTQHGYVDLYMPTAQQANSDIKCTLENTLSYKIVQHYELTSRYISDMAWNPIISTKLAIVSNANTIHIMDFDSSAVELLINRKITIKSTKAANTTVKWSNCNANILLTCGLDGVVRVWNLANQGDEEIFAKSYHCPMMCGLFLPNDENVIVCAGKSTSLEFINISTEPNKDVNKSKSKKFCLHSLDNIQWATKAIQGTKKSSHEKKTKNDKNATLSTNNENETKDYDVAIEKSTCPDSKDKCKLPAEASEVKNTKETSHFLTNPTTLLSLTTKELNRQAEHIIHSILTRTSNDGEDDEVESLCCKLFRTRVEAKELLSKELPNQTHNESKVISNVFMQQVNSNLKNEILRNIQSKQLNEWHVSLAPSISYSFWQKCCEAFAEQLMEQGYGLQAATYMLAIYRQQDAIRMLMTREYFKEALLLARIYLQPEDPLNQQISEQWIDNLISKGNLTAAALICLLSKQTTRALECLMKIRNKTSQIEFFIQKLKELKSEIHVEASRKHNKYLIPLEFEYY